MLILYNPVELSNTKIQGICTYKIFAQLAADLVPALPQRDQQQELELHTHPAVSGPHQLPGRLTEVSLQDWNYHQITKPFSDLKV